MKKLMTNFGTPLDKEEQQYIFGGHDCDLPENLSTLCPGAVVINPITCLWWCE